MATSSEGSGHILLCRDTLPNAHSPLKVASGGMVRYAQNARIEVPK